MEKAQESMMFILIILLSPIIVLLPLGGLFVVGLGHKHGIVLGNLVGLIDSDQRYNPNPQKLFKAKIKAVLYFIISLMTIYGAYNIALMY